MKITLDENSLKQLNIFQNITGVSAMDCIEDENILIFVVPLENIGKAIGKDGKNIKNLKILFKKNIYIYGFVNNLQGFLKILIPEANDIEIKDKKITISVDNDKKAHVIGSNGKNIKIKRKILKRFFDIQELKIR